MIDVKAKTLAVAGAVGLAGALVFALLAASLARPEGYAERVAALDQKVAEIERLARKARGDRSTRAGQICVGPASAQADALRSQIQDNAGQLQLDLTVVEVAASGDGGANALETLRVRFEAAGSYEAAFGLLERLQRLQPQIFADTVDVTSKTTSVTLSFTGRAFCSA